MRRACNLLIVDDEPSQVRLLQSVIQELGLPHRCHHAVDGDTALRMLHQQAPYERLTRPQLILLDLNMPGMTGHEVLRHIKGDPELRKIPVIICSHSNSETDIRACYGEMANAYITKPADLERNIKLVQEIDRFWMHVAVLPS